MGKRQPCAIGLCAMLALALPVAAEPGPDVAEEIALAATQNDNSSVPPSALVGTGLRVGGGDILVVPTGVYYFTSFQIVDSASVVIDGDVRMCLAGEGPFEIGGMGIRIPADGSLIILSGSSAKVAVTSGTPFEGTIIEAFAK